MAPAARRRKPSSRPPRPRTSRSSPRATTTRVPELPEVEVVRRGLESHVVGRTIARVEVLHPRPIRRHLAGAEDFAALTTGRVVLGANRRGKYLWLPMDSGDAVLGHLGMSDQLDPLFDEDAFVAAVRRRTSGIKRILLDQTVVSGVGNIYADEALWRAHLHGERPGVRLRRSDVRALLDDVRAVMAAALREGGTSFDALYVNVNGESGYFDRSLHAYGQEGRPCTRCGTPIRRVAFMKPLSYFCPTCQRRPRVR